MTTHNGSTPNSFDAPLPDGFAMTSYERMLEDITIWNRLELANQCRDLYGVSSMLDHLMWVFHEHRETMIPAQWGRWWLIWVGEYAPPPARRH